MHRPVLRHLRRCRLLFVLALCAWLGLAGSVFARADCCAGMSGMNSTSSAMTATRPGGAPTPLHADGMHADCTCAHATATVPEPAAAAVSTRHAATTWQASLVAAVELPRTPPLRPPLA